MERKYKERPSQMGRIMTNPRSKSEALSETCKERVEEKLIEDMFGVKRSFWSKEMSKGTECEDESIKYLVKEHGLYGAKKNEITFENEAFIGTPDLIHNGIVYDIKTSWSLFTFPMWEEEIPTKGYIYQLAAYMDLTGLRSAKLVYVLTDATEEMIQDELYRRCMRLKMIDATPELEAEVRHEMTFGHIDPALRIRIFDLEYNEDLIKSMKQRVKECEAYYQSLEKTLKQRITNNLTLK